MPHHTFTAREDSVLIENRGKLSSEQIGALIGRSKDAVRRRWRKLGLTENRPLTVAEMRAYPPREPGQHKRQRVVATKPDGDLVAAFLARRGVTSCPPAYAAGIAPLEQHLGFTAQPAPSLSYRERNHRQIQAAKARASA
jgi:hypothetical protein